MEIESEYIYLLFRKDLIDSKLPIYKLGRSSQPNVKRIKGYPSGSVLISHMLCYDSKKCEKELLKLFSTKYMSMEDVGSEYFSGNHNEMIKDIYDLITNKYKVNEIMGTKNDLDEDIKIKIPNLSKSLSRRILESKREDITTDQDDQDDQDNDVKDEIIKLESTISIPRASNSNRDYLVYPKIHKEDEIAKTEFMSNMDYTFVNFLKDLENYRTIDEILINMKKCLIHVIISDNAKPAWYAWDGSDIQRIEITKDDYLTGISDALDSFKLRLYDLCNKFNLKYNFFLGTSRDLEILTRDKVPKIPKDTIVTNRNITLEDYPHISHIFIEEKFNKEVIEYIKCCKKLYIEYTGWKRSKHNDSNVDSKLKSLIEIDNVKSSKGLTGKFNVKESAANDKFYRFFANGSRWVIKKKF